MGRPRTARGRLRQTRDQAPSRGPGRDPDPAQRLGRGLVPREAGQGAGVGRGVDLGLPQSSQAEETPKTTDTLSKKFEIT